MGRRGNPPLFYLGADAGQGNGLPRRRLWRLLAMTEVLLGVRIVPACPVVTPYGAQADVGTGDPFPTL